MGSFDSISGCKITMLLIGKERVAYLYDIRNERTMVLVRHESLADLGDVREQITVLRCVLVLVAISLGATSHQKAWMRLASCFARITGIIVSGLPVLSCLLVDFRGLMTTIVLLLCVTSGDDVSSSSCVSRRDNGRTVGSSGRLITDTRKEIAGNFSSTRRSDSDCISFTNGSTASETGENGNNGQKELVEASHDG